VTVHHSLRELIIIIHIPYIIALSFMTGYVAHNLVLCSQTIRVALLGFFQHISNILLTISSAVILGLVYLTTRLFRKRLGDVWDWRTTWGILLLDLSIILSSVAYVLVFNFLNVKGGTAFKLILKACSKHCQLNDVILKYGWISIASPVAVLNVLTALGKLRRIISRIVSAAKVLGIFALISIIVSSFCIAGVVDPEYSHTLAEFKKFYADCINNGTDVLECVWSLTLRYKDEFVPTYRTPCAKPRQLLLKFTFKAPPIFMQIDTRDFVAKLAASAGTGACLDFAIGVTKILSDLGFETRVVSFLGWDHAIPEVKINGTWFVIDAVYTTPNNPVPASMYGDYLKAYHSDIYASLKGLLDFDTGLDVSGEHGLSLSG